MCIPYFVTWLSCSENCLLLQPMCTFIFNNAFFHHVLQAKQQYEKEEKRKELKRQRGEDTLMLPEINQRLQEIKEVGYRVLPIQCSSSDCAYKTSIPCICTSKCTSP